MPKRKHAVFDTRKRKHGEEGHIPDWIKAAQFRLHRRLVTRFHSSIGDMGDTNMESGASNKRAKNSEAKMIPGLGPLEWGAPNSVITTLRYCDNFQLTSTSGATVSAVYRANGIYAPQYSGGGTSHQPMFRDAWVAMYDYYTVLGSKITVTAQSRNATNGFVLGLQGSDTPTLSSTVISWLEQNNGVHALIGNANVGSKTLTMTYGPEENLGANMKDDQSSMVSTGSDPGSQQAYYFGILASTEDFATTAVITLLIQIEYTVKFTTLTKRTYD